MLWKLFRLQSLLDSLFDETWLSLGLEDFDAQNDETPGPLQPA